MARKFLLFAALMMMSQASLAQAPEPSPGGEAIVAIAAEPPGWDPTVSTSQEIARVMYHNVFEGLVRVDRNGEIVPALAASWEVSDDGLEWSFELQDGVLFHDGSELTADDVVAKFERATDPESGHTHPEYYEAIESVTGEGNRVIFRLSRPSSTLLYNLARPDSIIYPAGTVESQRSDPVGTGPFRFVEWIPGSEVRLERFDDYYRDGVPYLDAVTFRIMGDQNARFAALQAGDIDMIGVALSPESAIQAQANPNLKVTEGANTTEITMAMNNTREPLDDLRVRQAITHAIDKSAIVEGANFGFGTIIGTHATPAEPYWIDTEPYPYDPQRARVLLEEAGYGEELTLSFALPEPYNIERTSGQVIAQQLSEVGIDVELSVVEWGTWLERIFTGGDYDLTIIGHSEPRDINVYGNPEYYYHYDNERVRELLQEAEEAGSQEEAMDRYREIAQIIADDAVAVWVFNPAYLVAAKQELYGFWKDQPTVAIDMTEAYFAE